MPLEDRLVGDGGSPRFLRVGFVRPAAPGRGRLVVSLTSQLPFPVEHRQVGGPVVRRVVERLLLLRVSRPVARLSLPIVSSSAKGPWRGLVASRRYTEDGLHTRLGIVSVVPDLVLLSARAKGITWNRPPANSALP